MEENGSEVKMGNDKYYWFELLYDYDFFNSDKIIQMECEPNGYEYESIYLKLFSSSLKNIDVFSIAKELRHSPEMVIKALEYFKLHGLMRIEDNNGEQKFFFDYALKNAGETSQ